MLFSRSILAVAVLLGATSASPVAQITPGPTVTGPPDLGFSQLPTTCPTTSSSSDPPTGPPTSSGSTSSAAAPATKRQDNPPTAPPTSNPQPPQETFPVPPSVIPSLEDSERLSDSLQAWVNSGYADNEAKNAAIDAARLYTRLGIAPDGDGIFYAGADGGDAANSAFSLQQGKISVGIAYYGYGRFPFDYCNEPAREITRRDRIAGNQDLLNAWFRITSIAFAQICSGTVFLVSNDANWRDSKGSGGDASIFVSDEADALANNPDVTKIYQVSTGSAYLWMQDTAPAMRIVANDALPDDVEWDNGIQLAYLIYDRDDGGFKS